MTNGLRDLLHEYADEAKTYDVRARALAAGRRRRTLRRSVPVTAVILVILGGFAVALRPNIPSTVDASQPIRRDPISLGGFPAKIVPADSPPPLPTSGRVGRAVFIYSDPNRQISVLVTADGPQYLLGSSNMTYTSSPNGRWLVSSDPNGTSHIRDLESSYASDVDGVFYAWSPDQTWLVTASVTNGAPMTAHVVLLDDRFESHDVDLSARGGWVPVSARADGQVVLASFDGGSLLLSTVDGDDVQVDLRPWLSDAELAAKAYFDQRGRDVGRSLQILWFSDDGRLLMQVWSQTPKGFVATAVLVVDLIAETVVQRLSLPAAPPVGDDRDGWFLFGEWPDWPTAGPAGLLLLRHDSKGLLLAVELWRPETRELFPVSDLSGLPR
jgi:hypothetical protein